MDAKELDTMVKAMRNKYTKVETRTDLEWMITNLSYGLMTIGKIRLAKSLVKIAKEIEEIDTDELVKLGTFRD